MILKERQMEISSGESVSLSSDGSIVAIGASLGTVVMEVRFRTCARLYEYISGVWTQIGADIDGESRKRTFGL
jgi:hypothetical protein